MKKAYVKPAVEMETFSPNEYIAACYALVDVNDTSNFAICGDLKNGTGTDGMNAYSKGKWNWTNKGFGDDHLDKLATDWAESHNGWFYDGPGMTHTTAVKTWEASNDTTKGGTMVDHMATQVNITKITESNAADYNTGVNAS